MPTFLHAVLNDQLFLAQDTKGIHFGSEYQCIHSDYFLNHCGFCDDFGPMNMASIIDFIRMLRLATTRKSSFALKAGGDH